MSMYDNKSGYYNFAGGLESMLYNTTGSYNTGLGYAAYAGSGALTNATAVGASAVVNASNAVVIGSSSVTSIGGYAGWTNFSDGRYKKNIQQNVPGLAFINKLNPVTYTLDIAGIETKLHQNDRSLSDKGNSGPGNPQSDPVIKQAIQDKSTITYTGFVAQDVEKAADSVGFTFSGIDKPKDINQSFYGLRYGDFVPPLVKAVQELSASSSAKDSVIGALVGEVDSLVTKYDALQAQVNELRALLQAKKSTASLDQNVPNPFTGSTVIGYNLPEGVSSAQMQITDITGKVLAAFPLSGSGKNTLAANVSGFAAGTYCYSLIVNGQLVATKQMVSVR
jgi:trimeric autotransporter adhesin